MTDLSTDHGQDTRRGTAYGAGAYAIWGAFPLYFHLLAPAGAWEILAHRILWTLLFCGTVLAVRREFAWCRSVFGNPRMLGAVTLAGLLIAVNWIIYVAAVVAHHVTEASLGYFLNPIVTVAIGVVVLRERLRSLQWLAVAIGLAAGIYLTIDFGRPPWIALGLAFSFAFYGLMKKRLGTSLGAFQSLTSETAVLVPVAVAVLVWVGIRGETTFTAGSPAHPLLLASAGLVTAAPLLLFAAAARRVPLVTIGLLQFVTPVLQLLCGVLLLGETMETSRWIGFGIVWIALLVLTLDSIRSVRSRRRLADAAESAAV
ncbi:MAG: EamA family transporter RarD [Actinobacteria bacterium]|nr:EamA family transporter RarD [Actinomycetota bacterium]